MEVQLLKNILTKLKANELFQALSRWSFLTNADVLKLKSTCSDKTVKRVLSNNIAEFCMVSEKDGLLVSPSNLEWAGTVGSASNSYLF